MEIITLDEVNSTSTWLREQMPDAPHGTVVSAYNQTAGRGQRGNSWEAEPGCNLTFSILLQPRGITAATQFAISEAIATAIVDTLIPHVPQPENLAIKWPNDIYYGDRKICGMLIENSIVGTNINRSIAGIGININQQEFRSNAPNPVSLWQITGKNHDLTTILHDVVQNILTNIDRLALSSERDTISRQYRQQLWRRTGSHPYRLPDGTTFNAMISRVAPDGMLTLTREDGTQSTYAFKEVASVI